MKRTTLIGMAAGVAVLACMPIKAAYAYIDPNSAGALYQFLFPLIIANSLSNIRGRPPRFR